MKTIKLLILSAVAWGCLSAGAFALQAEKIYPLPAAETEYVVIQWLQLMGFHLHRFTTQDHGVILDARKAEERWKIKLWPDSPLATRIHAKYTIQETDDNTRLPHLWSMLGDHMETIIVPKPETHGIPEVVATKAKSVVCIYSGNPDHPTQISGFIVGENGLIVCTAHGLKNDQQPITVSLHDGRQLPGWVVKMDKRYDLTLVAVNTMLEAPVPLANGRELLGENESLYNVVCRANTNGTIFPGTLKGDARRAGDEMLWQVNMEIHPGSSGSPVFDIHGNLVAIVKGRYRNDDRVGFLIPFSSLIQFLSDAPK